MKKITSILLLGTLMLSLVGCGTATDKDTFVIATDKTYPPFVMEDNAGDLSGIDMELMKAIAKDQDIKIEIRPLGFDAATTALESGEADAVIAAMTITDARKEKYDFSDPYFDTGVTIGVAKGSNISSYEDLRGKTVVAKTSTTGLAFAESIQEEYGFKLEVVEESTFMFEKVKSGEAVACFEDEPVLRYMIAIGELDFDLPMEKAYSSQYGFAVLQGENSELLEKFNTGLANIRASGEYDSILEMFLDN
jgi:ABC-type amino acid transport substrate-binding protein